MKRYFLSLLIKNIFKETRNGRYLAFKTIKIEKLSQKFVRGCRCKYKAISSHSIVMSMCSVES